MKPALVLVLTLAVAAIAMNTENKKQHKLPRNLEHMEDLETLPHAASLVDDHVERGEHHHIPDQMERRGGKGGKGKGGPPSQGWGWGPPPAPQGWGQPVHHGWGGGGY